MRLSGNHTAIQGVSHAAADALLQRHDRPVAQPALGLVDVEVSCNASVGDPLLGQSRLALAQHPEDPLEQERDEQTHVARQRPGGLGVRRVAHLGPTPAGEIEEVHGLVVGDEEGFAVDALVLERDGLACGRALVRGQQGCEGQVVRVRDVGDFGVVEQVLVVAELELGLAAVVRGHHGRQQLDVAGAEHGTRSDGGGEEVGVRGGAVRGQDVHLGLRLGGGVVLRLVLAHDDRVGLVGADQVGARVVDDAGRAGVHKGLHARLLRGAHHGLGAFHVDLVHELVDLDVGVGAGGVDDGVGLDLAEERQHGIVVGDVAEAVLYACYWVRGRSQVQDGDLGAGFAVVEEVHDGAAEESGAACDQHMAEVSCYFLWRGGHCVYVLSGVGLLGGTVVVGQGDILEVNADRQT